MQNLQFDYFWGGEAEQYSFYRIPKLLFTAECFQELSCEAKVLYGLMLDRMGLSYKNQWLDDDGRVYIIFSIEEVMEFLNCRTQKATKLLKELDSETGIGLIEKRRLGLGKPNVIYVKNFLNYRVINGKKDYRERLCETEEPYDADQNFENQKSGILKNENQEFRKSKDQNFENQKSRILKNENQEFRKSKDQNFENQKSRILKIKNQEFRKSKDQNSENKKSEILKIENQEFRKSKSNKTNINKTDRNDTILSNLSLRKKDPIEQIEVYRECIRKNISYDILRKDGICNIHEVDELVELMVEVMMLPDDFTVRIAGNEKAAAVIKSRFMKLTMMHITYVLNCLHKTSSKVGNIKAYLLTALYNAAVTMEHYYQAEVNHDMYGVGCAAHHDIMSRS